MDFSNASEMSLSDSMSGYVTCIEEDEGDNTHYLSVLSQDISLEEMNVTLSNAQMSDNDETLEENAEDIGQPLFFTIDGSDEIYGVQIARDEEGNLQKLQAQYTENIKGELVPMLETLQMLPLDQDVEVENNIPSENGTNDQNADNAETVQGRELSQNEFGENLELQKRLMTEIDIKPEPLRLTCTKKEIVDFFTKTSSDEHVNECEIEEVETDDQADSSIEAYEENDENDQINSDENIEDHFEQLFVEEDHEIETEVRKDVNAKECGDEMLHIEAEAAGVSEIKNSVQEPAQTILKETVERQTKTNILKKPAQKSLSKNQGSLEQMIFVQTMPEKENMEVIGIGRPTKPNSRSLLLCNQPGQSLKKNPVDPLLIKSNKNAKRFSRSKEAKEARQFINFINATTIPQVPERKERLPRKQQIKPVQHPNEDIVVKEMIVSSNGFVEPISAEEKKNLPVTEYVELLDSGDELNNDNKKQRKKKSPKAPKPPIEIEISDSEESETSVIELDSSKGNSVTKQKRGRTSSSKNSKNDKKDPDSSSESPPKMSRTESEIESVTSTLEVISMANKSEQNNEREEITMDVETEENTAASEVVSDVTQENSEETIEVKEATDTTKTSRLRPVQSKKEMEYKFECEKCKSRFINKFILNRHNCASKSATTCDICKRKFPNVNTLNVHAKTHFKQPLIPVASDPKTKKTEVSKIAVSKISTRNSVAAKKTETPKPPASVNKTGAIPKRPLKQPAKLVPSEQNITKVTPNKASSSFLQIMQCDKCPMKFTTNQAWFDHQVLKHELKTPDKAIGEVKRKRMAEKIVVHSGVQAKSEVKKHFSILRSKFHQTQQE